MTRWVLAAALAACVMWMPDQAAAATYYGTGGIEIARLPWLSGENVLLSTGWGGCTFAGTHCAGNADQYAVDWAESPSANFWTLAARERNVTSCVSTSSAGHVLTVTKSDGLRDKYLHLQSCPSATHVEQGDFLAIADGSGTSSSGPHLHFEKINSSGQSLTFNHSGITNFCDHTIAGFCSGNFGGHFFVSDNAGPGVNTAGNLSAWGKIHDSYMSKGDYTCGWAWDCFGSSLNFVGEGRLANRSCPASDCGWNQDFKRTTIHNFSWPEACTSLSQAYWVPDQFFVSWLSNTWLGQPRSKVMPFLGVYYQFFRYGYMVSPAFGGTPTIYSSPTSSCGAS